MTDFIVNLDESVATATSSLLRRAIDRDNDAWERLEILYSPLVYKWCRQRNVPPDVAADVGQEVFLAVARNLPHFRRDDAGGTFRGWLRTITANKLKDYWKKGAPVAEGGSAARAKWDELPEEESAAEAEESVQLLYRRMIEWIRANFSERDFEAFQQVVLSGRRVKDVAAELQVSPNVVSLAKSRILASLRQQFGDEILDEPP